MDSLTISDGTTTLDLNDGSAYRLVNWQPSYDGGETIRFEVLGSATQIASRVRDVENALMLARRRQKYEVGARWWLQWQPNGLSNEVEAEILDGTLRATGRQSRRWELQVEREPFWRGAEVTIPLSNGHGTDVTTGLQVDNTDDGSRDNYVEIDGADVDGDMPALTRLIFENSYNVATDLQEIRAALRTQETNRLVSIVLENADADSMAGSSSASGSYSGGNRHGGSLAGAEVEIGVWTITPANARQWSGLWRVLLRANFPEDVWALLIRENTIAEVNDPLAETDADTNLDDLIDLGILRLPPWSYEADTPGPFKLMVRADGTGSWWLDYVLLMPASEGFRRIADRAFRDGDGASLSWGVDYQDELVDDGIYDEVSKGDATRTGRVEAAGARIYLVPGVDQRIYVSMVNSDGGAEIARTVNLTVEARPRYRFFKE